MATSTGVPNTNAASNTNTNDDLIRDAGEMAFDISRETAQGSSLLSRYFTNIRTQEVAYYCEVTAERVAIYRGDGNGPLIAATESFQGKDGITEVEMVETASIVPIRHKHHTLPLLSGYAAFKVNGKSYEWKKHQELKEVGTDVVLARFEAEKERGEKEVGRLVVLEGGREMLDLTVVTCLVDQVRGDEGKWKRPEDAIQQEETGDSRS